MSASGLSVPPQQVAPFVAGANSPQTNAYINGKNDAVSHNEIIQVGKGRPRRRYKGGSGSGTTFTVAPVSAAYPETSTGSQSTSNLNIQATKTLLQGNANAKYDSQVSPSKGGSKRKRTVKRRNKKGKRNGTKKRSTKRSTRRLFKPFKLFKKKRGSFVVSWKVTGGVRNGRS